MRQWCSHCCSCIIGFNTPTGLLSLSHSALWRGIDHSRWRGEGEEEVTDADADGGEGEVMAARTAVQMMKKTGAQGASESKPASAESMCIGSAATCAAPSLARNMCVVVKRSRNSLSSMASGDASFPRRHGIPTI